MTTNRISFPLLAFALPALILPTALGLASLWALRQPPTSSSDALPRDAQATNTAPEPRLYQPLIAPIIVSLPGQDIRLKIEIGVALRAAGAYALLSRLKDRPDVVRSGLAETVMRIAEDLASEGRPESLRDTLPDALRDAMNQRLKELGEEPAIIEVLITNWTEVG